MNHHCNHGRSRRYIQCPWYIDKRWKHKRSTRYVMWVLLYLLTHMMAVKPIQNEVVRRTSYEPHSREERTCQVCWLYILYIFCRISWARRNVFRNDTWRYEQGARSYHFWIHILCNRPKNTTYFRKKIMMWARLEVLPTRFAQGFFIMVLCQFS